MTSVLFTYPLELIRVRMAFQTRHSDATHSPNVRPLLTRVVNQIYQEGSASSSSQSTHISNRIPILKFYRGFTATMAGMIPYAGVSFLCWGHLRAKFLLRSKGDRKPTPLFDLAIGAVAGATAQTVSYPFEVIRRRMQVGGLTRPGSWLGWRETVRTIWRTSGVKGFYVGLSIGYLKVVPMNAVSFTVWVGMKRVLDV